MSLSELLPERAITPSQKQNLIAPVIQPQQNLIASSVPNVSPNNTKLSKDQLEFEAIINGPCIGTGRIIYSVFHSIMLIIAIYLSWRCNKGFNLGSFLVALIFPYIYVIYIIATQGTCGILSGECNVK